MDLNPKYEWTVMSKLQRDLYLASRTVGDVEAARRGRLHVRILKRLYHRRLIGLLRRGRLW